MKTPVRFHPATALVFAASLSSPALWAQTVPQAQAAPQTPAATAASAPAEPAPPAADAPTRNRIELGGSAASLSDGNASWRDAYVRGHSTVQPGTTLNWELASQGHFEQRGTLGALSVTHELSPDWYMRAGGAAATADFQNRYRFDAGLYRKWGASRQWVTGLALMRSASNDDVHRDTGVTASVAYYSPDKWVGEGGVVYNRSSPGAVNSYRGFTAWTFGEEKKHFLSLRLDHGQEAYLPAGAIAPGSNNNVRFNSTEATMQWRQWISPGWGYVLGVQGYRNPYYNRVGANAGVFFDF